MINHHMGNLRTTMNSQEEKFSKCFSPGKDITKEAENRKRKCLMCGKEGLGAELPGWFRSDQELRGGCDKKITQLT